jgi:hypothetical protein
MSDNPYARPKGASGTAQPQRAFGGPFLKVALGVCIVAVLIALFLPLRRNARGAAYRMQCGNNLKHIALALRHYENENGTPPPLYTVDANGRRLHSWRTLILPFLDQEQLYETIDLSKPWDDPSNTAAYDTSLSIFRCPSSGIPPNHTTYAGLGGENGIFRSTKLRYGSESTEGLSVMVVEVSPHDSVHWMAPQGQGGRFVRDFGPDTELPNHGGTQAAFSDGSVRFLSEKNQRKNVL